jgi:hypothetical protein
MTMLDLRYESPMHETGIWLKQAKIIGRMSTLGEMHMPQKGTTVLHDEGILLIKTYLKTLNRIFLLIPNRQRPASSLL